MEFNEKLWHGSYMDSLRTMQHDYLAMMNNTLEILLKSVGHGMIILQLSLACVPLWLAWQEARENLGSKERYLREQCLWNMNSNGAAERK